MSEDKKELVKVTFTRKGFLGKKRVYPGMVKVISKDLFSKAWMVEGEVKKTVDKPIVSDKEKAKAKKAEKKVDTKKSPI